jgi:predicted porin
MMLIGIVASSACASAFADGFKDPLPDSFTFAGVTFYGTVDVGYAYQSEGVPLNSKYVGGLEYQAFTTTRNFSGSVSTLAESGLEQSKIGLLVDRAIADDFKIVARLETGFNPLSAQLTDACASIVDNSGVPQGKQTANADSSRCGQPFNSQAFGGVSSKTYGTLTIGRHNSLQLDALSQYDPQVLSYAFSFLGYSGFDGGAGSTQAARWDNSAKYVYQNGPYHVAVMYSNGGADVGILDKAYAAEIGGSVAGFSLDAVYERENGAVNLRSSFDNVANPLVNPLTAPGLAAYISDDTSWNLMGKYTLNLGGETTGPANKATVYAGYSHIQKAHSSDSTGASEGDYPLSIGININDSAEYNLEWVGAKLELAPGWKLTAAYYHILQNSWTIGVGPTGNNGIGCSTVPASAGLLCAGRFNEASFSADYVFNKHYDVYAGVNYSQVTDGLANGFVGTTKDGNTGSENQTTVMVGFRVKF